jgi:hypothetical protein
MHVLKRLLLITLLLTGGQIAFAGQLMSRTPITENDYPYLPYQLSGTALKLPQSWKFINGDDPQYANPAFDDSGWRNVNVGASLAGSGWRWYRTTFELPSELNGHALLLDLGGISVYDELYVNGRRAGHFGTPPPTFVHAASHVFRKYPIPSEFFKPGSNTIAVRVFPGYLGGLYEGAYTLQRIADDRVAGKLNMKTSGANALETLLVDSFHVPRYAPGARLLVGPNLLQLFQAAISGSLTVRLHDAAGKTLARDTLPVTLNSKEWTHSLFEFKAPTQPGSYHCEVRYEVNGKPYWQKSLPFEVSSDTSLAAAPVFEPKVDAALTRHENRALPLNISSSTLGHFGPRESKPNFELYDNIEKTDARSGVAYTAQVYKDLGAPLLFLGNMRPVPQNADKLGKFHRAGGHMYDGLGDAWIYGKVRPNRADHISNLTIKNTSWAKRTYRYTYRNQDWMEFSVSAISPAWVARTNAEKLRVFEGARQYGIDLPTHLAYESNGNIKVVKADAGINGNDMSANWVLAWFNGGNGWGEFDTPYLFVLEKRPEKIENYSGAALFFNNAAGVGIVQGMPLYGVTLKRPDFTQGWTKELPQDVIERCRYWSRVLVNAPDEITRTANVDYAADELIVKDEFTHLNIQDDWKTQGIRTASVSPVLALAAKAGNIDIALSRPARDLRMGTLQGPYVAADNTDTLVFRIKNKLHYIREVRSVENADTEKTRPIQQELNQIVAQGLKDELTTHPWKRVVAEQKLKVGSQRIVYTNLLLTLPYLNPELREAVKKEIQLETEQYFLHDGKPDAHLAAQLSKGYRDLPQVSLYKNPYTGLTLGMAPHSEREFGIDQPYFTALNTYMVWAYADTLGRYDWVKEKYPVLQAYFNTIRNSHDWALGVSWDTFSGFRVGNGMQESGGIYSGMVGMARMAHKLGDKATSDAAAYYAMMQMVGMQGQVAASDYHNAYRPWLGASVKAEDIEYLQRIRPVYFAEYNEFAGISPAIIGLRNWGGSPGGYIESPLPELMRLYQEVWPEFTNEFYARKYDLYLNENRIIDERISLDAFVYQMTKYDLHLDEVLKQRQELLDEAWWTKTLGSRLFKHTQWWNQAIDYRAYLDAQGKIEYRTLW